MKNKEVLVYIIFIVFVARHFSIFWYSAAILALWLGFYMLSGKMVRSLWLTWLGVMLLNKVAYVVNVPDRFLGMNYPYTWFFSDLLLVGLLLLLKFRRKEVTYEFGKRDWCLLLVTVASLVGTSLLSISNYFAWYNLLMWVKYLVVFYVATVVLNDEEIIYSTVKIILTFSVFNCLLVLGQKINGGVFGWDIEGYFPVTMVREMPMLYRPTGTVGSPNLLSSILLIVLPLTGWLIQNNRKYLWVVWGLISLAILMMASRFVWLLWLLMMVFVLKKGKVRLKFSKWWLVLLLLIPFAISRWQTLSTGGSLAYRWSHLTMTMEMLTKRPWGIGWDMFRYEEVKNYTIEQYFYDPSPQHNLLLEVFSGAGIVGGLIYLWWWKLVAVDLSNSQNFWIKLAVVAYFVVNQVYSSLFSPVITNLFWVVLAIFYSTSRGKIGREN